MRGCVWVSVREKDRETQRDKRDRQTDGQRDKRDGGGGGRGGEKDRKKECVCLLVWAHAIISSLIYIQCQQ